MKSLLQIALIIATVASIAVAVFLIFRQTSFDGIEVILPVPTAERELDLKVYVSGAVRTAGVYVLNEGDRLEQAIEAAGGTTADADLTTINLAIRVKDEGYYYIPRAGETPPPLSVQQTADTGQIDINTATADQLSELPGYRRRVVSGHRDPQGKERPVLQRGRTAGRQWHRSQETRGHPRPGPGALKHADNVE